MQRLTQAVESSSTPGPAGERRRAEPAAERSCESRRHSRGTEETGRAATSKGRSITRRRATRTEKQSDEHAARVARTRYAARPTRKKARRTSWHDRQRNQLARRGADAGHGTDRRRRAAPLTIAGASVRGGAAARTGSPQRPSVTRPRRQAPTAPRQSAAPVGEAAGAATRAVGPGAGAAHGSERKQTRTPPARRANRRDRRR